MLFGKKREQSKPKSAAQGVQSAQGATPVGYTKSKRFFFFKVRSKPIYTPTQRPQVQRPQTTTTVQQPRPRPEIRFERAVKPSFFSNYINNIIVRKKGLATAIVDLGIKKSAYDFVKGMMINAILISIVAAIAAAVLLDYFGVTILLALVLGIGLYQTLFNRFLTYPIMRGRELGKLVERDILFAARDLVVGMRSGMPLFNAMTAVSTGYGDASREFAKVVERIQLGMPIEKAMEEVSSKSESRTFKRLMLQASVSIRAGVDVTSALQEVVDEVTQERVIDLRRYGQKLNALAMFYMLFGVIFPSMGIAVATIMTTFISIFTINYLVLILVLVFIAFLQIIFLNVMRTSRPVFAM